MVRVFRGFRFDEEVYDAFCSLATREGFTATGALMRYMEECVLAGRLVFVEDGVLDCEVEARVLVDWLGKGRFFYRREDGVEVNVSGRLLGLLGKVSDPALKRSIEEALKSSVSREG